MQPARNPSFFYLICKIEENKAAHRRPADFLEVFPVSLWRERRVAERVI
jgi:hypothetical protein